MKSSVIRSSHDNHFAPYQYIPGQWGANLIIQVVKNATTDNGTPTTIHIAVYVPLPNQPQLAENVIYKTKGFPMSIVPADCSREAILCAYVFCMHDEKKLSKYGRTGREFTAPNTILAGICSIGLTALVTIPVSTFLLFTTNRTTTLPLTSVVWTNDDTDQTSFDRMWSHSSSTCTISNQFCQ
jgi:hypothetical protein